MERRNQVRPLLRRDLQVVPQQHQGRRCYVVKDPVTLRYYRFQESEHFILQHLDGQHSLAEVQLEFERRFSPQRLRLEEVEAFTREIITSGLAAGATVTPSEELLEHRQRRQKRERYAFWSNLLSIQFPLCDPDRFLSGILRRLPGLFSGTCFILGIGLILAALSLVAAHWDSFWTRLPGQRDFFTFQTIGYLWLAIGLAKIGHELGHGLTCKAFGGEVHELGVMLLCFSPCLYCDVSDAWMIPNKWRRIFVSCAGIYVELVIAALATFIWWNTASQPLLQHLCLSLMIVCSAGTIFFNANPLLRYDGYYAIADWLELPNLYGHARQSLFACVGACVLGIRSRVPWRGWLAAYGLASSIYRWSVTAVVLWMFYRFLKPHRLETIGMFAAAGSVGSSMIWPLTRLAGSLGDTGRRWEPMNYRRLGLSFGILAALLAMFFLVPLPLGGIRQIGLLQVQPEHQESLFIEVPGVLTRLYVQDGARVEAGELLAEFRSAELESLRAGALAERDVLTVQVQSWRDRLSAAVDPADRAAFAAQLAKAQAERPRLLREVQLYEQMLQRLQLRAPRAGVVLGLPRIDELGRFWNKDPRRPFCRIGATDRLWVLVPLETVEYRWLQEDFESSRLHGQELSASICVPGRGARTWPGRIVQLPETNAADIPAALSQRAGGPVAAKPHGGIVQPLSQQYLVAVNMLGPDDAVCPGGLANVAIRGRWRTAADCLWRMLAASFDLGFLT